MITQRMRRAAARCGPILCCWKKCGYRPRVKGTLSCHGPVPHLAASFDRRSGGMIADGTLKLSIPSPSLCPPTPITGLISSVEAELEEIEYLDWLMPQEKSFSQRLASLEAVVKNVEAENAARPAMAPTLAVSPPPESLLKRHPYLVAIFASILTLLGFVFG